MMEGRAYQPGTHAGDLLHLPQIRPLDTIWGDRRVGVGAVGVIAALSGAAMALAMPRGPVTAGQALVLMALGFAVGGVSRLLMRSRWAMLLSPVAHVAAFELARLGTDGPLVDGFRFDTTYGILAIILGRGLYALLGLLPMMLGVAYGAGLARRLAFGPAHPRGRRQAAGFYSRRAVAVLTTVALIALAVLIARPATTPAITGADGKPLPGSIATLERVRLGGQDQWIMIRGQSVDKPVLLSLAGGPGGTDLAFTRALFTELERDFVVVGWDQRGAGKSYPALDPVSTMTVDQAVTDTIELTNYLRTRFDEQKIYVMGESWGSTLGVLAVKQRPDLFYAYIGAGQMVSQRETDQRLYRDVIAYAERTGNDGLAQKMLGYGEPPYQDLFAYSVVMGYYEALSPYTPPAAYEERGTQAGAGGFMGMMASEYNLIEKVNILRGLMDTFFVMYPQVQDIDLRQDAAQLDVPVYILQGKYELSARADLVPDYVERLQAPSKRLITFGESGHAPAHEEFGRFHQLMLDTILPETYPGY